MGIWIVFAVQVVLSIATLVAALFALAWARAGAKDGHEARKLVEALLSAFRKTHRYPDPSAAAVVTGGAQVVEPHEAVEPAPVPVRALLRVTYTGRAAVIVSVDSDAELSADTDVESEPESGERRVIIPPPPSGLQLPPHLPPRRDDKSRLPSNPGAFYALAQRALYRYQGAFARHELDDLRQEVVIAAAVKGRTYNPEKGTVEQWVAGITRNCVREYVRKNASEGTRANVAVETLPAPDDDGAGDMREAVLRGLGALPALERKIVARHVINGKTFRQIAAETGIPVTTVHARYTAGMARLREAIGEKV